MTEKPFVHPLRDSLTPADLRLRPLLGAFRTSGAVPSGLFIHPLQTAPKSALKIIEQISNNPRATMTDIANLTGYSRRWVAQTIKRLQEQNILKRIGSDKSGHWEIIG